MRSIKAEDTIYIAFTTRAFATGIPTTLAGSPIVSAYEDAGLTQITAGITLGIDHDGVTGLNMLTIVATAANGYDTGKDYNLVVTTGTVATVSVVGEVVGEFSVERDAVDVVKVSGDATAADNLELDYDGTGYNKANSTIGTTTTNTDMVGTDGANTTTPPTAAAIADAICDEDIVAAHNTADTLGLILSQLTKTTVVFNTEVANDSIIGQMVDDGTASYNRITDSMQAAKDNVGVAGLGLTNLGAMSSTMKAEVNAECDTALSDYGANTTTPPTAAAVADQVWDETLSGHLGAGSTGEALNAAGAAGDPWTTALPGVYGAGSAGKIIGDNINAPIATVDTVVDAIKAVTDALPDAGALTSLAQAAALATVDTVVDGIQTDLSNGTDGLGALKALIDAVTTDVGNLNDLSAADVLTTALTEAYAADTVAPTLSEFLFMIWSHLHDFGISGTTVTSRKLDNTTAMTHTLDDGTNPTDKTRAT